MLSLKFCISCFSLLLNYINEVLENINKFFKQMKGVNKKFKTNDQLHYSKAISIQRFCYSCKQILTLFLFCLLLALVIRKLLSILLYRKAHFDMEKFKIRSKDLLCLVGFLLQTIQKDLFSFCVYLDSTSGYITITASFPKQFQDTQIFHI